MKKNKQMNNMRQKSKRESTTSKNKSKRSYWNKRKAHLNIFSDLRVSSGYPITLNHSLNGNNKQTPYQWKGLTHILLRLKVQETRASSS